jgi:hypothetical protein
MSKRVQYAISYPIVTSTPVPEAGRIVEYYKADGLYYLFPNGTSVGPISSSGTLPANVVTSAAATANKLTVATSSTMPTMVDGDIVAVTDVAPGSTVATTDPYFTNFRKRDIGQKLYKPLGLPTDPDPTISYSAQFAGPAIANAAITLSDSGRFRYRGGTWATGTTAGVPMYKIVSPTDPPGVSLPGSVEFATAAAGCEIRLGALQTGTAYFRVWVDGRIVPFGGTLATKGVQSTAITGNTYFHLILSFTGRSTWGGRVIKVEMTNVAFAGVYVAKEETVCLPAEDPASQKVVWFGDSFFEGTDATTPFLSMCNIAATLLGWDDSILAAQGGTGYLTDASPRLRLRTRLAEVIGQNPNTVVVGAGYNDYGVSNAALLAEAQYVFGQLRAGLPNARFFALGPWSLYSPPDVSRGQMGAQIKTAVEGVGGFYIDMYTDPWINGTGTVATPAAPKDGNASLYVTSSGDPHPPQAGHDYYGYRMASAIAATLAA